MRAVDLDLASALKFAPQDGKLLLEQERMVMFRQQSLGLLRELLHSSLGPELARSTLMQFGYQSGVGDLEALRRMYAWDSDAELLAAGPIIHGWEGIVHVEPGRMEIDVARGTMYFEGAWRNSYEAEVHLQVFGPSSEPVCHTLTGYASGYSTAFLGRPVLAIEHTCVACGAPRCTWSARLESEFGPEADPWRRALASTTVARELQSKLQVIEAQRHALQALTSPVIQVWSEVLALPLIGRLDDDRAASLTARLLDEVQRVRARYALIDLTGVDALDAASSAHVLRLVRALRLLGCEGMLCGISPAAAQAMTAAGVELRELRTHATLHAALAAALAELGVRVER